MWIGGYYPGWEQFKLPPSKLRFDALTHLFHFSGTVQRGGEVSLEEHDLTPTHIRQTVAAAHAAKRKILFVVGGAGSGAGFESATSPAHRARFVANILDIVTRYGYDGADIDWEPLVAADNANYRAFIADLRAALKAHDATSLLTAATTLDVWNNPQLPQMFADLQSDFDQINVMTYDMAGPWPGWISWHNAPLFSGDQHLPDGMELPSMQSYADAYLKAGVVREKLGVGLAFYGGHWTGVSAPLQSWKTPPAYDQISYAEIMARLYAPARAHYDAAAQTPYLSFDDNFISYTDADAITARLKWARGQQLGGAILWELAQDAMPDGSQPLTEAVARFETTQRQ